MIKLVPKIKKNAQGSELTRPVATSTIPNTTTRNIKKPVKGQDGKKLNK